MIFKKKIDNIIGWNYFGSLLPGDDIKNLPSLCKDRVLFIFLILRELPMCDDMHWIIVVMLKVSDVVKGGDPEYWYTWT